MEVGDSQEERYDTDNDNLLMYTQKAETLEPFSSHVIPMKTVRAYLGEHINVMVQAPMYTGWHLATGPHCTEYIHQIEEGQ